MSLLCLPTEILNPICELAILSTLQPERRLHPCFNSRYLRRGSQRVERPCPPLMLCCKSLHRSCSEVFYQNVTIVVGLDYHSQPYYFRRYPTPDSDKDTVSALTSRKSVLPYIKNLELMVSQTMYQWPEFFRCEEELYFRSNWKYPSSVISKLGSKLPNFKSLAWTVAIGQVVNTRLSALPENVYDIARAEDEQVYLHRAHNAPIAPSYYHSMESVLQHRLGRVRINKIRLWLVRDSFRILLDVVEGDTGVFGLYDPGAQMMSPEEWFPTHPLLKPIAQIPRLERLEIFAPQDCTCHDPGQNDHEWVNWCDKESIKDLKLTLSEAFSEVKDVRFWRSSSENVTSVGYEAMAAPSSAAWTVGCLSHEHFQST